MLKFEGYSWNLLDCTLEIMFPISERTLNHLPNEVLLHIFSYLPAEDLAMVVPFVCLRWSSISSMESLWKHIIFTPPFNMSDSEITMCIKHMPKLRSFQLFHGGNLDEIVTALCEHCVNLQSVIMKWKRGFSLEMIKQLLNRFPLMECLDVKVPKSQFTLDYAKVHGTHYIGERISVTSFMDEYRSAWLLNDSSFSHFGSAQIRSLIEKRSCILDTLVLSCHISSEIFRTICKCINLKFLFLFNEHDNQTEIDITPFIKLKNLMTLQLECFHNCTFDIKYFNTVEFLRLERIQVVGEASVFDNIFDNFVKNCPKLNHLNLKENPVFDHYLQNISCCSTLTYIDIAETPNLTDDFVKCVAKGCLNLQFFDVSYCDEITQKIVRILRPCQKLQCLRMNGIKLNQNIFMLIPVFYPSIKEVSVKHCRLKRKSVVPSAWLGIKLITCFKHYEACLSSDET